jgi:predicted RNase H-like HicB family nuclease
MKPRNPQDAEIRGKMRGVSGMKIKAVVWQEDDVWCASVPALPGCHTWGESYDHLLEMLEDAIQVWLEVAS